MPDFVNIINWMVLIHGQRKNVYSRFYIKRVHKKLNGFVNTAIIYLLFNMHVGHDTRSVCCIMTAKRRMKNKWRNYTLRNNYCICMSMYTFYLKTIVHIHTWVFRYITILSITFKFIIGDRKEWDFSDRCFLSNFSLQY